MKVFTTKKELSQYLLLEYSKNRKIGFVPTMGALHAGHISLIKQAKTENDLVVASVYVNPTQFNNPEDLLKYPKQLETDANILAVNNCDVLFAPSNDEMYGDDEKWTYEIGYLNSILEAKYRKGHYEGVTQIVYKLFNIVKPHKAYFGQKDYQQLMVIKKMNVDLELNVDIVCCPIVREDNGLAMSSRNIRLSEDQRIVALNLHRSLSHVKSNYHLLSIDDLKKQAETFYNDKLLSLEYFEICDVNNLLPKTIHDKSSAIALVACYVGDVRLIDNMMLN